MGYSGCQHRLHTRYLSARGNRALSNGDIRCGNRDYHAGHVQQTILNIPSSTVSTPVLPRCRQTFAGQATMTLIQLTWWCAMHENHPNVLLHGSICHDHIILRSTSSRLTQQPSKLKINTQNCCIKTAHEISGLMLCEKFVAQTRFFRYDQPFQES